MGAAHRRALAGGLCVGGFAFVMAPAGDSAVLVYGVGFDEGSGQIKARFTNSCGS